MWLGFFQVENLITSYKLLQKWYNTFWLTLKLRKSMFEYKLCYLMFLSTYILPKWFCIQNKAMDITLYNIFTLKNDPPIWTSVLTQIIIPVLRRSLDLKVHISPDIKVIPPTPRQEEPLSSDSRYWHWLMIWGK